MIGYVYRIIAPGSNSVYVGQSTDPVRRFLEHKKRLRNPHLANFLKKHPDAEIYFWPVLDMNAEEIADEQECRGAGFDILNCTPCGGRPPSQLGKTHSAETRARLSVLNLGREKSAETRAKLREVNLGKKLSPETRALIGAVQKGKKRGPFSQEHCASISRAKVGRTHSHESRVNMSLAHTGKPWSAARRAAYEKKWGVSE